MKIETVAGAFIAAAILFVSSVVTLFTNDPNLTFGELSQATWVSLIGGTAVAFLKDYQAVSARRAISRVTGSAPVDDDS